MRRVSTRVLAVTVLLVALVLAGVVSRFADSDPDGLTKVSEEHGFADTEEPRDAVLGDYGGRTGVIGVLVVLALTGGLTFVVRRRDRDRDRGSRPEHEQV